MGGITLNTTEHYQLNQWDGSDRIMREDFNADNRKTEEALTELAEAVEQKVGQAEVDAAQMWVKIGESKLSQDASQISFKFSDLAQYHTVRVYLLGSGGWRPTLCWGNTTLLNLKGGNNDALVTHISGMVEFFSAGSEGLFMNYSIIVRADTIATHNGSHIEANCKFTGTQALSVRTSDDYLLSSGFSMVAYGLKG